MKITYYSKYGSLGPSSRYRVYQYADLLRKDGFDFSISELFDRKYFDILRSGASFRTLKKIPYTLSQFRKRRKDLKENHADLAIIEHQLFPYVPFGLEKNYLPARYLLEFDDAIYLTHPEKMPKIIRNAHGIIAGNETLAAFAKRFHSEVHIIPTALDTEVFKPPPLKTAREKIVIGWSGLEYNFHYLKYLSPVLQKILKNYPVEICILSGSPPGGLGFPFRFERWDPEREVMQLAGFDIGLMPLEMDDWSKGKCGFKLLQYMSLEIPSIATPVGVNQQIVEHGVNGFLAHSIREWEDALIQLITDARLRRRLGSAARSTVWEKYSTRVWYPRIAGLYASYAGQ